MVRDRESTRPSGRPTIPWRPPELESAGSLADLLEGEEPAERWTWPRPGSLRAPRITVARPAIVVPAAEPPSRSRRRTVAAIVGLLAIASAATVVVLERPTTISAAVDRLRGHDVAPIADRIRGAVAPIAERISGNDVAPIADRLSGNDAVAPVADRISGSAIVAGSERSLLRVRPFSDPPIGAAANSEPAIESAADRGDREGTAGGVVLDPIVFGPSEREANVSSRDRSPRPALEPSGEPARVATHRNARRDDRARAEAAAILAPLTRANQALLGPLEASTVRAIVGEQLPRLEQCYTTALRRTGTDRNQRVTVTVDIAPSGRVTNVDVDGASLDGLAQCLRRSAARWTFPPSTEGAQIPLALSYHATRGP